jgi:lysine 2,3-aminomutase
VRLPLAPADDPTNWRWQLRHAITDLPGLEARFALTPEEREGARRALEGGFPLSITPYYASLADPADPGCPIRRQCVPRIEEAAEVEGDLRDPLGEEAHEIAPHLVQRYPDRALLLVTDRCSVYCRFCTRSRMVGQAGGARSDDALAPAFGRLEADPTIREVIVSGGDPFVMATGRLARVLERLGAIAHLDTVRVATRAPVTLPQRVDAGLAAALRAHHPAVWVMTHFNHPRELSEASRRALATLVDAGLPVMNQTVLLRGINDDAGVLEALFRGLVRSRVRPYYLLQADPVRGTGHLRTPLSTGLAIVERLQGRLSGIAVPRFIVDTPKGKGKVPLGPDAIVGRSGNATALRTFRGEVVSYVDPPP